MAAEDQQRLLARPLVLLLLQAPTPAAACSCHAPAAACCPRPLLAPAHTGARPGYVFTTRDAGTGYYADAPLHLAKPQAKKPVTLKSNSLVKGLQRRPNAAPDPKKRKTGEAANASSCCSDSAPAAAARRRHCRRRRRCPCLAALPADVQTAPHACRTFARACVRMFGPPEPDSSKPAYLREMERYKAMSCSSDTKHDRPLVK